VTVIRCEVTWQRVALDATLIYGMNPDGSMRLSPGGNMICTYLRSLAAADECDE
jgi:hypothetical protein